MKETTLATSEFAVSTRLTPYPPGSPSTASVYRDAPAPGGGTVTYAPGTVVGADAWQEMWDANGTKSYLLAVGANSLWPTYTNI